MTLGPEGGSFISKDVSKKIHIALPHSLLALSLLSPIFLEAICPGGNVPVSAPNSSSGRGGAFDGEANVVIWSGYGLLQHHRHRFPRFPSLHWFSPRRLLPAACYDMEELRPLLGRQQWAEFLHVIASHRRPSPGGRPAGALELWLEVVSPGSQTVPFKVKQFPLLHRVARSNPSSSFSPSRLLPRIQ